MDIELRCAPILVRPDPDDGPAPPVQSGSIGDPAATVARCVLGNVRFLCQDALTLDGEKIIINHGKV